MRGFLQKAQYLKRNAVIIACILALLGGGLCALTACRNQQTIVVALYNGLAETEQYEKLIADEWKARGNNEKLQFVAWNCYNEPLPETIDVCCFDGVVFNTLMADDVLEPIGDASAAYAYPWTMDAVTEDGIQYAVPFLLCSNFVISHGNDSAIAAAHILSDLDCSMLMPLKDIACSLYLKESCLRGKLDLPPASEGYEFDEEELAIVFDLAGKMSREDFEHSTFDEFQGAKQFRNGEADALYAFSETLYALSDVADGLSLRVIPSEEGLSNAFYVDFLSVRKGVSAEKRQKCLELIEVITDGDVQYEYLRNGGKPLYYIPANKDALSRLAAEYPRYREIQEAASKEGNVVVTYRGNYRTDFSLLNGQICELLLKRYDELLQNNG